MRFYYHMLLEQLYISLDQELTWHFFLPDGTLTRWPNLHMARRVAPCSGNTVNECAIGEVRKCMFTAYMREISVSKAAQIDPALVAYALDLSVQQQDQMNNTLPQHPASYSPPPAKRSSSPYRWRKGRSA